MPWSTNDELPASVRNALPKAAMTVWRKAANQALAQGKDDSAAAAIAWTAVRNAGYRKTPKGWVAAMATLDGIEIFRTGKWKGRKYADQDLDGLVGAWEKLKGRLKFPVKLGHNKEVGAPAAGWIENLRRQGNKLVADLKDVPADIAQAWREKRYRQVSSEIAIGFDDAETGEKHPLALVGVALLGAELPAVPGLNSDHTASLPDTSACHVVAHAFDVATESGQIMETGDLFSDTDSDTGDSPDTPGDESPETKESDMAELEDLKAQVAKLEADLAAAEEAKAEFAQTTQELEDARKQLAEIEAANRAAEVEVFLAKHSGAEAMRIMPAQIEWARAILTHADTNGTVEFSVEGAAGQQTVGSAFRSFVEALPDQATKMFGEIAEHGDAEPEQTSAKNRVHALTLKRMDEKSEDYAAAMNHVLAADSTLRAELAAEYKDA